MRGHGRRSSTSSVETVDEGQIRWRQEASVVRRVPEGCGSDEWPVFELQDAIVLNQDGQTVENALEVGIKGPFIVRGQLTIDDAEQKQHRERRTALLPSVPWASQLTPAVLMRVRSSMPIEIRQSKSYSMGESDGGRPIIWVSGRGGWYELKPCKAYRAFYNKMCEATTLYYNLIDIYSSKRPKKKKKPKGNFPMEELSRVFLQVRSVCTALGPVFLELTPSSHTSTPPELAMVQPLTKSSNGAWTMRLSSYGSSARKTQPSLTGPPRDSTSGWLPKIRCVEPETCARAALATDAARLHMKRRRT